MPNGLARSFFPSCYLSRPVVWGESVWGPTPTRGSRLGRRGPLSWCPPWSEGSRQNWVWKPGQSGEGCSWSDATMALWKLFGMRGEWNILVGCICSAEGVWDLVPPTKWGSC